MRTTLSFLIGYVAVLLVIAYAQHISHVVIPGAASAQDITYVPGDTFDISMGTILACPQQDGPTLREKGLDFKVRITLPNGKSNPRISAKDIWLGSDQLICGGRIVNADDSMNEYGVASFSGALRAGGGGDGNQMYIMVHRDHQDLKLAKDPDSLSPGIILPIRIVSPDIDGDGDVDLGDKVKFDNIYKSGSYNQAVDYNMDGSVDVKDQAIFEQHFGHTCRR